MTIATLLIFVALGASLLLLLRGNARLWPVVATAASGIEAAYAFRLIDFVIKGVPLPLVLAGVLTAAGGLIWIGTSGKLQITAATLVAFVGVIQVATLLL